MTSLFFPDKVPSETIAMMAAVSREIINRINIPLGINVLRNDADAALAIASTVGADFIRVNIHTNAVVADQGLIQGKAYATLRKKILLQSKVLIFADVGVKHASPLKDRGLTLETQDISERGMADALIVSGTRTGEASNAGDLNLVKQNTHLPVLIGSGMTPDNICDLKKCKWFYYRQLFQKESKNEKNIGRIKT